MSDARAVNVKARAVVRHLGHSEGDTSREYKDWHIEIRSGLRFTSVWSSSGMVFLAMVNVPVFYRPGPWEQYLDILFLRTPR